jgi:hypothetical protein
MERPHLNFEKLGPVAYRCHPSYSRIAVQADLGINGKSLLGKQLRQKGLEV